MPLCQFNFLINSIYIMMKMKFDHIPYFATMGPPAPVILYSIYLACISKHMWRPILPKFCPLKSPTNQ